jgi:hypothetical protein
MDKSDKSVSLGKVTKRELLVCVDVASETVRRSPFLILTRLDKRAPHQPTRGAFHEALVPTKINWVRPQKVTFTSQLSTNWLSHLIFDPRHSRAVVPLKLSQSLEFIRI